MIAHEFRSTIQKLLKTRVLVDLSRQVDVNDVESPRDHFLELVHHISPKMKG